MKKQLDTQLLEFVIKHYIFGEGWDDVLDFDKPNSVQQALLDKINNYDQFKLLQDKLVNEHKLDIFETEDQINNGAFDLINDVITAIVNSNIIKLNI